MAFGYGVYSGVKHFMYDPFYDLFQGKAGVERFSKKVIFGFSDFLVALIWGTVECVVTLLEMMMKYISYITCDINYRYKRQHLRDQRIKG